ncbi:MAG TPA: S9 family peptidase [Dyella sp.]|uniref:alpha/beta hydrolase family protein n=1 Tax=Dyella sp. TaxID=1869338 RepID=UPI002C202CE5|nr:S9 family peptidase [Dyella sp.]HUB91865.1 S9 family peptidase [Dyella sp.]
MAAENAAPAAQPAAMSIKNFIRQPDFSQVTISPDGSYVAALIPVPDHPYQNLIAILDAKTSKAVHILRSGSFSLVYDYFWVSDNRIVASIAKQEGGLDTPERTGELFAIDVDGGKQTNLFGYRAGGMQTGTHIHAAEARDAFAEPISTQVFGDRQILIAINDFTTGRAGTYTSAAWLNVMDGHSTSITTSPERNARLVADHAGQVRVAYADNTYGGGKLWLRTATKDDWALVNDAAASHVDMLPIGFNRDNSQLYLRVSQGDKPAAIERMDTATHKLVKLYQGQFADPGALLPTADGQDYYAVVTLDGKRSLFYFDENAPEAKLSMALAANFPGQLAYFSSFTRDGKHAIVKVISDRDPGDYYVFDLATSNAHYLLSAEPWIDPNQMRPMQPIELKARDGLSLHGFLTLPAGNKPFPLIVLPHGGPHGIADRWAFDGEVQLFANRGYAVLQVNYRGSGGYGDGFQALGYRQWGLSMQDDLTDATRWAIDQGYADAHRVCIYGASYGGYAALEGAVREPDLYKCAVGYAGVYDLRVQLDKSDTQRTDQGSAYLQLVLGNDRNDLLRRSPLGGVDKLKADVLLIHGGADPRVPFKNFKEFTAALDKLGKHYESLVEPDEGHGFFLPEHRKQAYQKMVDFFDSQMGTAAMAGAMPSSVSGAAKQ